MEQIKKLLRLPKASYNKEGIKDEHIAGYYETHLLIVNCLLPVKMTPMEIRVLSCFMGLEGDIAQHRFGPSAKKIVMAQLEISPAGLSNYITFLLRKDFLIKRGDIIEILPILIPEPNQQMYLLKLENIDYAERQTT